MPRSPNQVLKRKTTTMNTTHHSMFPILERVKRETSDRVSQRQRSTAQQVKALARRSPSAKVTFTYGSPVSTLEPSDMSDHDSAADSGIIEPMTEDDEAEDHTMDDISAAENVPAESGLASSESSDEEESDEEWFNEEPLQATSLWPRSPSKENIARLPICSGLDDDTSKGRIPKLTARDVVVNALVSVQFLEEMGEDPISHGDIGIDSEGHLFKIDPARHRRDDRNEFCDVVLELKENWMYKEIREQMQAYLDARHTDYFDDCAHEETKHLASLINKALRKKTVGLPKLEAVAAECKRVVETLDKIITLANAVKQDLLDTGSTSFKRWKQLQSTGLHVCLLKYLANGVLDTPTPAIVEEMVKDITRDVSAWQARLGLTLKLERDLELTMAAIPCY